MVGVEAGARIVRQEGHGAVSLLYMRERERERERIPGETGHPCNT